MIFDWRRAEDSAPYLAVFPFDRDEADANCAEEFSGVEGISDFGERVGVGGELDALVEAGRWKIGVRRGGGRRAGRRAGDSAPYLVAAYRADFGDQGAAEGEDDVAIVMGVLENGVAPVIFEAPTGRGNDLVVAIEGGVGGDEIEAIFDF